jgi:hypothetical protein
MLFSGGTAAVMLTPSTWHHEVDVVVIGSARLVCRQQSSPAAEKV